MLHALFWITAGTLLYVYVGYPLILWLLARRRAEPAGADPVEWPAVTLIISAYNEADVIADKLRNALETDYPEGRLEIIVVSDASDDGTDRIVASFADRGVVLLRMPERGGKTVGLNAAVAAAKGDFIVFSDANAMYRVDAVKRLVARFEDPAVGAVIGESSYYESDSDSGRSESLYWRYESAIKKLESATGSLVGGDGAIYAIRKSLYRPMPPDALSDFVNPLQIVQHGYRCVYEPRAVSCEETAADFTREYRRKVRIVNRAWRALWSLRAMLNPLHNGGFALKLWSHKVLRWWVPFLLLALLAVNWALLADGRIYVLSLWAQAAFYAAAAFGYLRRGRPNQPAMLRIPYYFCLVNVASAVGLIEAFLGRTYTTWTTARTQPDGPGASA